MRLGEYLYETGSNDALLAAFERAVELVPAEPPSPERAYALASLAGGLMVAWRHAESLPIAEQALALARAVGAREAEVRALTVLGGDLAYLGRGEEGLAHFRQALQLAEEIGDRIGLERAYVNFTDALTMLGRPRESARLAQSGLEAMRRYGIDSTLLVSNQIEALLAIGDWDEAEQAQRRRAPRASPRASRTGCSSSAPTVEIGRGEFDAARAHLEAASATLREDRVLGLYDAYLADLALWERRWTDADAAIERRVWLRRAIARLRRSASSSAPRDCARRRSWQRSHAPAGTPTPSATGSAARGSCSPPLAAPPRRPRRSRRTPPAGSPWPRPSTSAPAATRGRELWSDAAATWDRLERPPLAAYCRWRQAEALVAAGASRAEASVPLREAHAVATRIGAKPLLRELELLAERARLDLAPPDAEPADDEAGPGERSSA